MDQRLDAPHKSYATSCCSISQFAGRGICAIPLLLGDWSRYCGRTGPTSLGLPWCSCCLSRTDFPCICLKEPRPMLSNLLDCPSNIIFCSTLLGGWHLHCILVWAVFSSRCSSVKNGVKNGEIANLKAKASSKFQNSLHDLVNAISAHLNGHHFNSCARLRMWTVWSFLHNSSSMSKEFSNYKQNDYHKAQPPTHQLWSRQTKSSWDPMPPKAAGKTAAKVPVVYVLVWCMVSCIPSI